MKLIALENEKNTKKKKGKKSRLAIGWGEEKKKRGKKKNEKLEVPARAKGNIRGLRALLTHENTP